jgi:alcohol dehydrogenase, propanol-preferring
MTMRAVRVVGWEAAPVLTEMPVPKPGPGEVLLEVVAAGLCHSDLHIVDWPAGTMPWELPFTLGHENAGTVLELGAGATGVEVGDHVVVYGPWGCGACWQCSRGAENLCPSRGGRGAGCGLDGGLAEYLLVPSARYLVPIPGLDPVQAAALTDAGLSPYHAIKTHLDVLRPGSSAVVIGVGGLGHVAVQLLRALSPARVVAVDVRADARELALRLRADAALEGAGLTGSDVRDELGGPAQLVLDFVGSDETLGLGTDVLAAGGRLVMVGLGGGSLPRPVAQLPFDASVSRPSWGTLPELREVVELAARGAITIEVERLGLDDTLAGYDRLREGSIAGRAVVVP